MLVNLNMLVEQDEYEVKFGRGMLTIGKVVVSCESQHLDVLFNVSSKSIKRLVSVFSLLEEQPVTIAVDADGWLYIKEAII